MKTVSIALAITIKSFGFFLMTLGSLILVFVGLKSLTFDSISQSNQTLSLLNPFHQAIFIALVLMVAGFFILLLLRVRPSR